MIVPQNRLIAWTGIIVVPSIAAIWMYPPAKILAETVLVMAGIISAADIFFLGNRRKKIQIGTQEEMKMSKGYEREIRVILTHQFQKTLLLSIAPSLPSGLGTRLPFQRIIISPDNHEITLNWPLTGLRVGILSLSQVMVHIPSPLRLFLFMDKKPVKTVVRVYPDISNENRKTGGMIYAKTSGNFRKRQVGKGKEFEQLKEYQPFDSYEDIHWKATAKIGYPVTKMFQTEKTQEIYIVVDASRLSSRLLTPDHPPPADPDLRNTFPLKTTVFETFMTCCLSLCLVTQNNGDRFGFALFSDSVSCFLRAGYGIHHYGTIRDALLKSTCRNVSPDFSELFTFLASHLRKRALIIFLTSLDDPVLAENFSEHVGLISRQHIVLACMPKISGVSELFSNPPIHSTNDLYSHLAGHFVWESLIRLQKILQSRGVDFSFKKPDSLTLHLISRYLELKQRQHI